MQDEGIGSQEPLVCTSINQCRSERETAVREARSFSFSLSFSYWAHCDEERLWRQRRKAAKKSVRRWSDLVIGLGIRGNINRSFFSLAASFSSAFMRHTLTQESEANSSPSYLLTFSLMQRERERERECREKEEEGFHSDTHRFLPLSCHHNPTLGIEFGLPILPCPCSCPRHRDKRLPCCGLRT